MRRFGRRRKAAAYRRIADLEYRLSMESTAHLYDAEGVAMDSFVTRYTVTQDGAAYEIARFSATVYIGLEALDALQGVHVEQRVVRFMGRSYMVMSIALYHEHIMVELEGVA